MDLNCHLIQSSFANAFCRLLGTVADKSTDVAMRTSMLLPTLKKSSLKVSPYSLLTTEE